eukprot:gene3482-20248_t
MGYDAWAPAAAAKRWREGVAARVAAAAAAATLRAPGVRDAAFN